MDKISIFEARQNNLKSIDLEIPHNSITVITGPSGAGKSSLAMDTLYAEGQRLYAETFSAYARQFLDRVDRPDVRNIESIMPATAVRRKGAVRTARSTVGTLIEAMYSLEHLFALGAVRKCDDCNGAVKNTQTENAVDRILEWADGEPLIIGAPLRTADSIMESASTKEILSDLAAAGWTRVLYGKQLMRIENLLKNEDRENPWIDCRIDVVLDRLKPAKRNRRRLSEAVEHGWRIGRGILRAYRTQNGATGEFLDIARGLVCSACNKSYPPVSSHMFSFNTGIGACSECNGYGNTLEWDGAAIVPDEEKTLREGAVYPFTMPSFHQARFDLLNACIRVGIKTDIPFKLLTEKARSFVFRGDSNFYGVEGLFDYLQKKQYKMHVRVLLSRFRKGVTCRKCKGSRLSPEALRYELWGKTIDRAAALTAVDLVNWLKEQKQTTNRGPEETLLSDLLQRAQTLEALGLGHLTLDRPARTLSGGELSRVHLTRAVGSRPAGTLYILDEPTTGLHCTDVESMCDVIEDLSAMENTVVVVENNPIVTARAHHVVELGPESGEKGGRLVYEGPCRNVSKKLPRKFPRHEAVLVEPPEPSGWIHVENACINNIRNLSLSIPLGNLVVITGVSGSGKSSLLEEVIFKNLERCSKKWTKLLREKGKARTCNKGKKLTEWIEPVANAKRMLLEGRLKEIKLLDQNPIGRSSRSNPATYMKALDPIRKLFAEQPDAKRLGMGPGCFSFNSPSGRCPRCEGAGFEKIEMQFLADMELRCPECNGNRYRPEVLNVRCMGLSIADILNTTVDEAVKTFSDHTNFISRITPMQKVGLGYLKLGQPATTLSGGEAQRMKLARILHSASPSSLLLLDEPTAGLHESDIEVLVNLWNKLVSDGVTVWVVEHDLSVISRAHHLIDLGPGGGPAGGKVVVQGDVIQVAKCKSSRTGKALQKYILNDSLPAAKSDRKKNNRPTTHSLKGHILVQGAREHNLQDITVKIPRKKLVGITGVSGSGKSTLAFDIVFAEGQRLYLESRDAYIRTNIRPLPRPNVQKISGIPPTAAVSQRTSGGSQRSTVAVVTEISHYLRLLYSRFGVQYCPDCDVAIKTSSRKEMIREITRLSKSEKIHLAVPVVRSRKGRHVQTLVRLKRKGFEQARIDGCITALKPLPELARYNEHDIDAIIGVLDKRSTGQELNDSVAAALNLNSTIVLISDHNNDTVLSTGRTCPGCNRGFEPLDPLMLSFNSRRGACPGCGGLGIKRGKKLDPETLDEDTNSNKPKSRSNDCSSFETIVSKETVCKDCNGQRLRPESRSVKLDGITLPALTALFASEAVERVKGMKFIGAGSSRASEIVREVISRISALDRLGLGYLTLDRRTSTLSSGEAQRVRLAALLGSGLSGACYVLDEPTIGLHPQDTGRMLSAFKTFTRRGCTVVVVEHDESVIRSCDHVIDMGPGAGKYGGRIVESGTVEKIERTRKSKTGQALREAESRRKSSPCYKSKAKLHNDKAVLTIKRARLYNLKNISVSFLQGSLNAVTGVSGSGKSSLVMGVLADAVDGLLKKRRPKWSDGIQTTFPIDSLKIVTSAPIGHTSRSVVATYLGIFDHIRNLFSGRAEAKMKGYSPASFSFNVDGGRCDACRGKGETKVEMKFLPDVFIPCEFCETRRYRPEILDIMYRGHDISSVLSMSVRDALDLFQGVWHIRRPLELLSELGLDYLAIGQPSPTLSGGEAQRIRLASEISSTSRNTIYLLDEPTTGLHMADVKLLIQALRRLASRENTIVIIEHNLDLISECDHVVDLGPGGGPSGGSVTAAGPPAQVALAETPTGVFLGKNMGFSRHR